MTRYAIVIVLACAFAVLAACAGCKKEGDTFIVQADEDPARRTWSAARTIVTPSVSVSNPRMAIDSADVLHVAWQEDLGGGNIDIFYLNSGNWAASPVNITNTADYSAMPSLAVDSNNSVHLTWMEESGAQWTVNYANETNWSSTALTISSQTSMDPAPKIALGANDVAHVVWAHYGPSSSQVWYANSSDWAVTETPITTVVASVYSTYPVVGVDAGGVAHAVWGEFGGMQPCMRYANSANWAGTLLDIAGTGDSPNNPAMTVDSSGTLHVVWEESQSGPIGDIIYSRFDGSNWSAPVNISNTHLRSRNADVAVDAEGTVHIAWVQMTAGGIEQVYYANSAGWIASRTLISDSDVVSTNPSIAVDSKGTVHLLWSETAGGGTSNLRYAASKR